MKATKKSGPRIVRTVILLLSALLTSCLSTAADGLSAVRATNRTRLLQLRVGMDREAVLKTMGTESVKIFNDGDHVETINNPYRNEMYQASGHRFEILYYYTDTKSADSAITDDELTPLVMKDGALDGWGWSYLKDLSAKYEIRFR